MLFTQQPMQELGQLLSGSDPSRRARHALPAGLCPRQLLSQTLAQLHPGSLLLQLVLPGLHRIISQSGENKIRGALTEVTISSA